MRLMPVSIHVYGTKITTEFPRKDWYSLLAEVPTGMHKKILRYDRWQDQHRSLFGKLLLKKQLQELGEVGNPLERVQIDKMQRPWIPGPIDFNITHAGDYVLCAAVKDARIGIDVERVKPVDLDSFSLVMTSSQIESMRKAKSPLEAFFKMWTLKESVVKANGKGLTIPLNKVETDYKTVKLEAETWYLLELSLDELHFAHLACSEPDAQIEFLELDFSRGF